MVLAQGQLVNNFSQLYQILYFILEWVSVLGYKAGDRSGESGVRIKTINRDAQDGILSGAEAPSHNSCSFILAS
jgi:hypothetical protein